MIVIDYYILIQLLDIDGVLLENKYLHERVKIQESELELSKQSVSKYKVKICEVNGNLLSYDFYIFSQCWSPNARRVSSS